MKNILCKIFGHKFQFIRYVDYGLRISKVYKCQRCSQEWSYDSEGNILVV